MENLEIGECFVNTRLKSAGKGWSRNILLDLLSYCCTLGAQQRMNLLSYENCTVWWKRNVEWIFVHPGLCRFLCGPKRPVPTSESVLSPFPCRSAHTVPAPSPLWELTLAILELVDVCLLPEAMVLPIPTTHSDIWSSSITCWRRPYWNHLRGVRIPAIF